MTLDALRASGTSLARSFDTAVTSSEPAGWTVAVARNVIVAGGMGISIARIPPRRTGTVTATSWPVSIWRAFQPSVATARYRRPSTIP